jgi:hypothetical protein
VSLSSLTCLFCGRVLARLSFSLSLFFACLLPFLFPSLQPRKRGLLSFCPRTWSSHLSSAGSGMTAAGESDQEDEGDDRDEEGKKVHLSKHVYGRGKDVDLNDNSHTIKEG